MIPVPQEIQPLVYLLDWGAFCFSGNCQHFLLRSCLVLFTDLINCVKLPVAQIRVLQASGSGISVQGVTEMAAEPIRVHVQVTGIKWSWYVISGFTGFASQWLFLADCLQHKTVGFGVGFFSFSSNLEGKLLCSPRRMCGPAGYKLDTKSYQSQPCAKVLELLVTDVMVVWDGKKYSLVSGENSHINMWDLAG